MRRWLVVHTEVLVSVVPVHTRLLEADDDALAGVVLYEVCSQRVNAKEVRAAQKSHRVRGESELDAAVIAAHALKEGERDGHANNEMVWLSLARANRRFLAVIWSVSAATLIAGAHYVGAMGERGFLQEYLETCGR